MNRLSPDHLSFHNVAEFRAQQAGGWLLQRVPEDVRARLNPIAQQRMQEPYGVEVRFVPQDWTRPVRLTFRSLGKETELWPFWGMFAERFPRKIGPEPTTLEFVMHERMREIGPERFADHAFKPWVCRLLMRGDPVLFIEGEGDVRLPRQGEVPRVRLLAYGTSITQGIGASHQHACYVNQVCRELGWDVVNLGSGGSALCEEAVSDYMAAMSGWDVALLCVSVNMVGHGIPAEEFERRVRYMLERLTARRRPILCLSVLPHFGDLGESPRRALAGSYREVLSRLCGRYARVQYLSGERVLTDYADLLDDLIHPSDYGMTKIARGLAPVLRSLLA
ncbi:MAG: SGNH/GDSL hydrolase family protein [Verrucomicrobiota bacterium JB024]|nr:SGNH/GDSL hydrolase family protein [Verrucomicrobiota bacterium JB024]